MAIHDAHMAKLMIASTLPNRESLQIAFMFRLTIKVSQERRWRDLLRQQEA
jgi:hypothetical protein